MVFLASLGDVEFLNEHFFSVFEGLELLVLGHVDVSCHAFVILVALFGF